MFEYLKGIVTDKKKSAKGCYLVIEVANIGYSLEITEHDFLAYNVDDSETVKFYVCLIHREDVMSLFGFSNKESRDIFKILMSVSGVGAKMAIALLNEFNIYDLISFVIDGNYKELTRAKGVGPKLAQKIILELQDKLIQTNLPVQKSSLQKTPVIDDAYNILLSLGYEDEEINTVLNKVIKSNENIDNPEELLRKALTTLSM